MPFWAHPGTRPPGLGPDPWPAASCKPAPPVVLYYTLRLAGTRPSPDIVQLKKQNINIPQRELVIFKEPEALASSTLMENVCHLGINKINDFTCKNGSDYMRAYSQEAELIDNRQEYKNLDHIKEIRSQQSFHLTDEDKKQQKKNDRKKNKLEQIRQSQMNNNDQEYS